MQTKTIANMVFTLETYQDELYVHIAFNGVYYDSRKFDTLAEAEAFLADPLADDRTKSNRATKPAAIDTSYLDSVGIRNIYRRTA